MPVALHATAEHRAVEDIERGEQGGDAVADIVVGHGAGLARLDRQTGLGPVQGLDLAFLIDREHQAVGRRLDVQADDVLELGGKFGIVERLKVRMRWGCSRWAPQIRCTERKEIPAGLAMARPVQWVASPGASAQVRATTAAPSRRPGAACPACGWHPAAARRPRPGEPPLQRQTAGRPIWARLATSATLSRSAGARMIRARATCFGRGYDGDDRLQTSTILSRDHGTHDLSHGPRIAFALSCKSYDCQCTGRPDCADVVWLQET